MDTNKKLATSLLITRSCYVLFLLVIGGNLWLQGQPPVIYFIMLTPLIIFAPGIITANVRTLIWMGFVLLVYFAAAVYGVSKPQPHALDIAELILTVVLFCASMFYARVNQLA